MNPTPTPTPTPLQRAIHELEILDAEMAAEMAAAHEEGDMEAWLVRRKSHQTAMIAVWRAKRAAYGPLAAE